MCSRVTTDGVSPYEYFFLQRLVCVAITVEGSCEELKFEKNIEP